jgi:hypothetical protein
MRRSIFMVVAIVVAGLLVPLATSRLGSATTSGPQLFCLPMSVIVNDVQKPVIQLPTARVPVLALTVSRSATSAPKNVARAMREMASFYKALAATKTNDDRAKVAFARAAKFAKAQKIVIAYYSTHCVQAPVTPSLPGVNAASQIACISDLETLRLAETEYSSLNGGYATMDQLVAQQLIKAPSVLHPAITVDSPPGGYTVVGNRGCNDVPVAG